MSELSRRTLLGGSAAMAMTASLPAFAQQAVMPPVRMVKANGIDLAVYEAGAGPAVVLLHGFPSLACPCRRFTLARARGCAP
jgi:soluble epoxide hydrolase / lipid-phosphate phosphatase